MAKRRVVAPIDDDIDLDDELEYIDLTEKTSPEPIKSKKAAPVSPPTSTVVKGLPTVPLKPSPKTPATMSGVSLTSLVGSMTSLFDFSSTSLTPIQQLFILSYALRGTKSDAAKLSNVPYSIIEQWMQDEEFTLALQNATQIVADTLEQELIDRAMNGSDRLLIKAMEAHKPKQYAKKQISGQIDIVHSWADLARQASEHTPTHPAIAHSDDTDTLTDIFEEGDDD